MRKYVSVVILLLALFLNPKNNVSAQTRADQELHYSYHIYLPITQNGNPPYYVSPEGNDRNPGTLYRPWKTIGKATRVVVPGDIVYVRGGVYQESIDITSSGVSTEPIKFLAYPGEVPVIDGNNFNIPDAWGALLKISGDFNIVSGFEVRYSRGMGVIVRGSYDIAENIYSHHNRENGILITSGQHSTVRNCQVWRNVMSNEYGLQGWNSSGLSAARGGVKYATIQNNLVWENWGEGLSTYEADHITIEDNIVHDNFGNVFLSDSTNVLFQRNFVYINPSSYVFPYGSNSGISLGDETYNPPSANLTIINNIAFGNTVNFWWWQGVQGGGMNNVLIANNTFVNAIGHVNQGQGNVLISPGNHQNVSFTNNIIQQEGDLPVIATINQPGISYNNNLWSKPPYPWASGPGDIISNPLLVAIGSHYSPEWFNLTWNSPAIGEALSLSEVTVDYFGHLREAPPDLGANEFFPVP